MTFIPAHSAIVLYAPDDYTITTATGQPPALADPDGSPKILGYTNLPQTSRGLANSKGFALGVQGAAYNKRGAIAPQIDLEIRPASIAGLNYLFPTDGVLTPITLYVLVNGPDANSKYIDVYRGCKPSSVDFKFDGKGGNELIVSASFMALTYQQLELSKVNTDISPEAVRGLGSPLFWHDVQEFSIAFKGDDHNFHPQSLRRAVMSISAKIDYGLERKNQRPDYGDNSPLSRTSYALLEHHRTVTGEVVLHERLSNDLFAGVIRAQDWGNIVVNCADTANGGDNYFTLTLTNVFPSDETQASAEASAEIDHTVPFTADDVTYDGTPIPTTPPTGP